MSYFRGNQPAKNCVSKKKKGGKDSKGYLLLNAEKSSVEVELSGLCVSKCRLPDSVKLDNLGSLAGTKDSRLINALS